MKKLLVILLLLSSANVLAQYYYNQYAAFDGIDDHLSTPSNTELNLDSAFTIEAWVYLQDSMGTNKTIVSTVNASLSDGYAVMIQGASSNPTNAGKLQLNLNGGNNNFIQTAGTRFALNTWTHFSVTFRNAFPNSDTIRFYINGTLIQTFTSNIAPLANSSDPLRVGNSYIPGNFSNGLKGRLDDLRIYKTQKTSTVIANDRGIPVNLANISNPALLDNSNYFRQLNAAWLFDGNGNDAIGVQNNLTASNGAYYTGNNFNPANYRNQSNFYMRYPGTSWLACPDNSGSSFDLDTACTIEAWVYIDAYRNSPQTIISKGTSSYSYILAVSSSPSNSPMFILNSGSKIIQSSKPILPRVWTHIAATYRSSTGELALFVNGNPDTNRILTPGNINLSNDSVFAGKSLFGEYMYGCIDGIKLSKNVKTSQQIKNYMFTSIDNLNAPGIFSGQSSFNFEGNTINSINPADIFYPRANVYFERLNNVSGASGYSQPPVIRLSNNDPGFTNNQFIINNERFFIPNGSTVRDSILVNGTSGNNRVAVVVLMNHTSVNDLTLNLRAPNGTSVNFHSAQGSTNNDIMTVFDDFADSLSGTLMAPFSSFIRPVTPLSSLPQSNQNGYWRLSVTDAAGNVDSGRVYMWGIKFISLTGITTINNNVPDKFYLEQNYPNPFNPETNIKFGITKTDIVTISIFDIAGKEIEQLTNDILQPGNYSIKWNASKFASGVYFIKLMTNGFSQTKKMLLVK